MALLQEQFPMQIPFLEISLRSALQPDLPLPRTVFRQRKESMSSVFRSSPTPFPLVLKIGTYRKRRLDLSISHNQASVTNPLSSHSFGRKQSHWHCSTPYPSN